MYKLNWQKLTGAIVIVITVIIGSYGVFWLVVANTVEDQIDVWVKHRQLDGTAVTYEGLRREGFPGAIRFTLDRPSTTSPAWEWRGDSAEITVKPWSLTNIQVNLSGNHQGMVVANHVEEPFTVTADNLRADIRLKDGVARTLSSTGDGLKLQYGKNAETLSLAEHNISIVPGPEAMVNWALRLRDLRVPQSLRPPMGHRVQHFDAKGQLEGPITGNTLVEALSYWRDQGGKLDVTSLDIGYAPLNVSGNGTFALDSDMQPIGAFTIQAKGVMQSVDRLVEAGLIKGLNSLATKLVLATLTKTPPGGGERYLELPLTLQDRLLTAGPFDLVKFRPIHW
jgi:hypothetical protein